MDHFTVSQQLVEQVLAGTPPSPKQSMDILNATGACLTSYMAGAHYLKEQSFNKGINLCSIINAKSGRCRENCAFCAQSAHFSTAAPTYPLKDKAEIVAGAVQAAAEGSHCFGIVTSGTSPSDGQEFTNILEALREIRATVRLEPSASLGLLSAEKARLLVEAGCATYHHNLETARSFFPQICTTHAYDEDVDTVKTAKAAGMKVCSGGILGLGESLGQRVELAETLRELDVDSVPLNFLNPVKGTPLENCHQLTPMECIRAIVLFRYQLPCKSITVCVGRDGNLRDVQ